MMIAEDQKTKKEIINTIDNLELPSLNLRVSV